METPLDYYSIMNFTNEMLTPFHNVKELQLQIESLETNQDDAIVDIRNLNETNDNFSQTNVSLPIDMQFNDGHILQISCYSGIFIVSLIGNLCVLKAILGGGRERRKSRVNLMLLHLAIADLI
ncbi:hypothetical protein SK128_011049, partial [Halocaridina rubra]